MVDPLTTAATTATQLKSILKLLPEERGRPKFGSEGNPEKESRCPWIEVFMASVGRTTATTELRRGRFKPTDNVLYAREAFQQDRGHAVPQEDIQDENDFTLSKDLLLVPMSTLSSGCRLNLNFTYRRNVITTGVHQAASAVTSGVSGAVGTVNEGIAGASQTISDAATNTPSWWGSWRTSSPTPSSED